MIDLGANKVLNSSYLKDIASSNKNANTSAILGLNTLLSTANVSQNNITDTCLVLPKQNQVIGSISNLTSDDILTYIDENNSFDFNWVTSEKLKNGAILVYKQFNQLNKGLNYYVACRFQPSSLIDYINTVTLLKNSTIYLVDNNHSILYSTDETVIELPTAISNELFTTEELTSFITSNYIVAHDTLNNGWKLVVQTPISSLTEKLDRAFPLIFLLLVVIVGLAIFFGYIYANAFSKPIIHLMTLMGHAEKGDLTVKAPVQGKDEIASLCSSFNHMMDNIKTLITETQKVVVLVTSKKDEIKKKKSIIFQKYEIGI